MYILSHFVGMILTPKLSLYKTQVKQIPSGARELYSVVEFLPSVHKALGLIPSIATTDKQTTKPSGNFIWEHQNLNPIAQSRNMAHLFKW
jgi:hypothetical protein